MTSGIKPFDVVTLTADLPAKGLCLPGCISQAGTMEELISNIREPSPAGSRRTYPTTRRVDPSEFSTSHFENAHRTGVRPAYRSAYGAFQGLVV